MIFEDVRRVEIRQRRWEIDIRLVREDGSEEVYVASADSWYTDGSGLWFGTAEEHAEEEART